MRGAAYAMAACLALAVLSVSSGAAREPGVVWLFFVDDLHIDFRTTGVVRAWLVSLVKELVGDDDVFALRTTGPSTVSVGMGAGVADLEHSVRRISGSALTFEEVMRAPGSAGELGYRARVALEAARELVSTAPRDDPRPRVMLYVGKGFDALDDAVDETDSFVKQAWGRDVRVIAIDIGAFRTGQTNVPPPTDPAWTRVLKSRRDSLEQLALPTRGFVIAGEESLRDAAARISHAVR